MGEMSSYYLEQEDPFEPDETYWRGGRPEPEDSSEVQRPKPTATIWVTREGQRIPVRDMADSHLINTIRMLRRQAASVKSEEESAGYSMLGYLQGEAAIDSVESDLSRLEDMTVDEWLEDVVPTWPALLAEAEKRGLNL